MSLTIVNQNQKDINCLPNEILYEIFKYLTLQQKLRVEKVCKRWFVVMKNSYLMHTAIKVNRGHSLGYYIGCTENRHSQESGDLLLIKKVSKVWSYPCIIDTHYLMPIISRCLNLKSIYLESASISMKTFLWMTENCLLLECLTLIRMCGFRRCEWDFVSARLGKRLKHLAISDCYGIRPYSLVRIVKGLETLVITDMEISVRVLVLFLGENIRKLSLINTRDSSLEIVKALSSGNGRNITHLTIHLRDSEDEAIGLICHNLKNLEHLAISLRKFRPSMVFLPNLKKLKYLQINSDTQGLSGLAGLAFSQISIESLVLNDYFLVKDLLGLETNFPNLKNLKFYFYCNCGLYISFDCTNCLSSCVAFVKSFKFMKQVIINDSSYCF